MQPKMNLALLSLALATLPFTVAAKPVTTHVVVAPNCLIKASGKPFHILSTSKTLALIEINDTELDQLISAKKHQTTACGGFMDVTQAWLAESSKALPAAGADRFLANFVTPPKTSLAQGQKAYGIKYQDEVNQLLKQLNPQNMWTDLTTLTQFKDRYARSDNGVKAAEWIKTQVETMAKNTNHDDVSVYFVKTGSTYKQPSVVAKLGKGDEAGIVIGGHMDTLSSMFGNKPGADDDGSGTVTVLEVARTVLSSGMHFKKPIYFIWYAAEEMGLVGSSYVVSDFKAKKIPVDAVMQFDMTGYAYKNDPTIWLINDYVDKDLTAYLQKLIDTYVKTPAQYTKCGYACSDHASWSQAGFKASMPFEAPFGNDNPQIHSSGDKMELLSLDHMTSYAKLGVAFAVELAEPAA